MSIEQFIPVFSSVIPSSAIDVIGVYNSEFAQVFRNARPLKAEIKETLKPMEHPLETSAMVTDHIVFQPTEITLYVVLLTADCKTTYETIKQLWLNGTMLVVQTIAGVYENQILQDLPHTEDPDVFGTITMVLKLHEVMQTTADIQPVPRNPADGKTTNRGTVNGKPADDSKTKEGSILHG